MESKKILSNVNQIFGLWKNNFSYYLPVKIIFGIGASSKIGEETKKFNAKNVLIITDEGLVKSGMVGEIKHNLEKIGIDSIVYDKVCANPTISSVTDAFKIMKEAKPDMLIGLGGGSSIDTAKIISIMETNSLELKDMMKGAELKNPRRVPLMAIETAAGTGAEITMFTPITDTDSKVKAGFASSLLIPDVAICDPLLTVSLPSRITAETGIDALSHSLEGYIARDSWAVTDSLTLSAIKLIFENLRKVVSDGKDIKAREGMLMGSLMAAMAFPFCGAGMVHGLAEPLSGFYNLSHGVTIGIMLPYVENFNMPYAIDKFEKVAQAANEYINGRPKRENAERAIKSLIDLIKDIKLPISLNEVNVKSDDLTGLTNQALKHGCMNMNPFRMNRDDIMKIYQRSFNGHLPV